ncbi:hypothetical protein CCP3SC1AL1_680009 [Gammaproteobacteria bacterium]
MHYYIKNKKQQAEYLMKKLIKKLNLHVKNKKNFINLIIKDNQKYHYKLNF